jgi:hypothetical protein
MPPSRVNSGRACGNFQENREWRLIDVYEENLTAVDTESTAHGRGSDRAV